MVVVEVKSLPNQTAKATREVAAQITQIQAAREVTVSTSAMSRAANDTGAAASDVLTAAADLSQQADQLTSEVTTFVAG